MDPLIDDPRFTSALSHIAANEWEEASELFEDLFFEAVRDEVELVRVFLKLTVGMHHVERGQRRAAVQRLEEGVRAIGRVTNDRGLDLGALKLQLREAMRAIAAGEPLPPISISRRE